jgi:hypothetical protein
MPSSPYLVTLCLAAALAALVAGSATRSGLPPEEAFAEAQVAISEGDADRALDLLGEAADAEHLGALRQLARAYEAGHLTQVGTSRTPGRARLAIRTWPGQATRAKNAYRRVLSDSTWTAQEAILHAQP